MRGKLTAVVVAALIGLSAFRAHALCFDRSVRCELHELNNNLERLQEDAQFDALDALIDAEYAGLVEELDNARTPADFERAERHAKEVYERLNRLLR